MLSATCTHFADNSMLQHIDPVALSYRRNGSIWLDFAAFADNRVSRIDEARSPFCKVPLQTAGYLDRGVMSPSRKRASDDLEVLPIAELPERLLRNYFSPARVNRVGIYRCCNAQPQ